MIEVTCVQLVMTVVKAMLEEIAMEDVIAHSPKVTVNHFMVVNFVVNITPQ